MTQTYHIRKVNEIGRIHGRLREYQGRYVLLIPLKIKTAEEAANLRNRCKVATSYCQFGFLGNRCKLYTGEFTQQLRPMIPMIREKVLNDCIKNPRKYLEDTEDGRIEKP